MLTRWFQSNISRPSPKGQPINSVKYPSFTVDSVFSMLIEWKGSTVKRLTVARSTRRRNPRAAEDLFFVCFFFIFFRSHAIIRTLWYLECFASIVTRYDVSYSIFQVASEDRKRNSRERATAMQRYQVAGVRDRFFARCMTAMKVKRGLSYSITLLSVVYKCQLMYLINSTSASSVERETINTNALNSHVVKYVSLRWRHFCRNLCYQRRRRRDVRRCYELRCSVKCRSSKWKNKIPPDSLDKSTDHWEQEKTARSLGELHPWKHTFLFQFFYF